MSDDDFLRRLQSDDEYDNDAYKEDYEKDYAEDYEAMTQSKGSRRAKGGKQMKTKAQKAQALRKGKKTVKVSSRLSIRSSTVPNIKNI